MTIFDDYFEANAFIGLLTQFGETVVYRKKASGITRSITAIVERDPPAEHFAGGAVPAIVMRTRHDATNGITIEEWQAGDSVDVPRKRGGTAVKLIIQQPLDPGDGGVVTWAVG